MGLRTYFVSIYGLVPVLSPAWTIPGGSDGRGAVPGAAIAPGAGPRDAFSPTGAEPAARALVKLHTEPGRTGGA